MARRIAVLGTEGGAKGVDGAQGSGPQLAFQLTADGEGGLLAEEVVAVVYLALVILLEIIEIFGRYLEHLAGPLTVAGRDDGRVEVVVAVLVEIGVDGHSHIMAYAHHGAKGMGAQPHVGMLAHILKALALLLHGVVAIACAEEGDAVGLNLCSLS